MTPRVCLYSRFNRFWHWSQALLVLLLGLTGLEIHGTIRLLGFDHAVAWHNRLAAAFGILVAFAIFWHGTTGQWRQYIPTWQHVRAIAHYYLRGIFHGEPHPHHRTEVCRLNPLQRLTYLGLKLLVFPIQGLSGLVYFYYDDLAAAGWLPDGVGTVAILHTAGAFALLAFTIAHVYLTTTGPTVTAHLRAMITGWEPLPPQESPPAPPPARATPPQTGRP